LVCSEQGTLIVAQDGVVDGDISVGAAIIDGSVRGDIRAANRVAFGIAARVIGDIETPELSIQPGAVFEGRCAFSSDSEGLAAINLNDSTANEVPQSDPDDQPELAFAAAG
jgi:cytoskeletal protein CcmA (bactofilin family)